jgi:hypothetical protein
MQCDDWRLPSMSTSILLPNEVFAIKRSFFRKIGWWRASRWPSRGAYGYSKRIAWLIASFWRDSVLFAASLRICCAFRISCSFMIESAPFVASLPFPWGRRASVPLDALLLLLFYWWDTKQLLVQLKDAIDTFELKHPGCVDIFVFDQSSAHNSHGEGALDAFGMNLGPGGAVEPQNDTYYPPDHQGQRASVSMDRGTWWGR